MNIKYMKYINERSEKDSEIKELNKLKKFANIVYDLECHKLRYFLLKHIGQEGYIRFDKNFANPFYSPNNINNYVVDLNTLHLSNPSLYNNLSYRACSVKINLESLTSILGFAITKSKTKLNTYFYTYTTDNYLEIFVNTDTIDKTLKYDIIANHSSKLLSIEFGNDIGRIIEQLSNDDELTTRINERAEYYNVNLDKYLEVLLFSKGLMYRDFKLRAKTSLRALVKEIEDYCVKSVITPYMLKKDAPKLYDKVCNIANENSISVFELLHALFYSYCYSYLPMYLNNREDQALVYVLEDLLLCKKEISHDIKKDIELRCNIHKIDFGMYLKGIGLFSYYNMLKNKVSVNNNTFKYDRGEEYSLSQRLGVLFSNKLIPSLKKLKERCNEADVKLYNDLKKYAKSVYMSDVNLLEHLGFKYLVEYQTEEYILDNYDKFIAKKKYFCAYANDPFYFMMERTFRPVGSKKCTKASTQGRANFIFNRLHLTKINANSTKVDSESLYITPSSRVNSEDSVNEAFARAHTILERFEYEGTVFIPTTQNSKVIEYYNELNNIAFLLGLHLTDFICKCGYSRRMAGGKVIRVGGVSYREPSVRNIGKLYAPLDDTISTRSIKEIYDSVIDLVNKSKEQERNKNENIIREFQKILAEYAIKKHEDDRGTVFLGKDSELYNIAKEIVNITKVDTVVLILHLGYSVYYISDKGSVYINSITDIFNNMVQERAQKYLLYKEETEESKKEQGEYPMQEEAKSEFFKEIPRELFEGRLRIMSDELCGAFKETRNSISDDLSSDREFTLDLSSRKASKLSKWSKFSDFNFIDYIGIFTYSTTFKGTEEDFIEYGFDDLENHLEVIENDKFRIVIPTVNDMEYKKVFETQGKYKGKYISFLNQPDTSKLYHVSTSTGSLTLSRLKRITSKPHKSITVIDKWVRNINMVKPLKEFYDYKCQLCGEENGISINIIGVGDKPYVELHHIKELSATLDETEGTDVEVDTIDNAIIVCPQHHKYLHYHKGGLNKLAKDGDDIFITNEDKTEFIRVITNKHLKID